MSEFRTGALSSFSGSADDFVIKHPFQTGANSLEAAAHFNHYFDACLELEYYLTFFAGGPLTTYATQTNNGAESSGSNLRLSLQTLTQALSGSTSNIEINFTVPEFFGANPFLDSRFSITTNVFLEPNASGGVRAVSQANSQLNSFWNRLIDLPQVYYSIKPTGGRNATLVCKLVHSSHGGSLSGEFFDSFDRPGNTQLGYDWSESENSNQRAIEIVAINLLGRIPTRLAALQSRILDNENGKAGIAYPIPFGTSQDQEIEFELYNSEGTTMCRAGPMIRFSGSRTNASFYGLALSNRTSPFNVAQLVLIQGVNLDTPDEPEGNNTWVVGSGTVTELGSPFFTKNSNAYGDTIRYRLKAVGTAITVDEKIGSGGWTSKVSVTNSALTNGRPGLFVKSRRVSKSTYGRHLIRNLYCRVPSFTPDNPGTDYQLIVNLLFGLIGSSSYVDTGTY